MGFLVETKITIDSVKDEETKSWQLFQSPKIYKNVKKKITDRIERFGHRFVSGNDRQQLQN